MPTLFSMDSTLMRGLTRFADVMILNLVFIATALPVVTLGAALTALNFTAMRIANGECNSVTGDYFRSFRSNFRQATIVTLLLALFAAVLGAWYVVITNIDIPPLAEFGLLVVWYVLAYALGTTTLFAFPYLATFEGSTRAILRNARLLSLKHPLTALGAMVLAALPITLTLLAPQATGYGMAWVAFGFAGIAVLQGHLFARLFRTYIAASAADQS